MAEIKEIQGEIFGSYYIIKYRGELSKEDLQTYLKSFFQSFNDEFSTYQKNSTISKFNGMKKGEKLKVSARFIKMLNLAKRFHQETNGAFDPTLGPVIKLWGFGGGKTKKSPSETELASAMSKVGFGNIKWDEKTLSVWKEVDGIELDVNAFAPGWATDLMETELKKNNVNNFMIDISGDILFGGSKGEGTPWVAGIEKPSMKYAQGVQVAFKIQDAAISTSGNYRQFFDEKGVRKSHILDPRTGKPVEHKVTSASVVAVSGVEADAWSTAMMVLGPKGLAISEKNDIKVLLITVEKPNLFGELVSPSMQRFIEAHKL